jgi:hypothetical protein
MNQKDCAVSPEGDSITLNLPDKNGRPRELVLTFDEASSLAMTLPRCSRWLCAENIPTVPCVTSIHCANTP